jgi:hypothetical protein
MTACKIATGSGGGPENPNLDEKDHDADSSFAESHDSPKSAA